MNKALLFNDKKFHFSQNDLPCLIHGGHGTGASLFIISAIVDLVLQGKKVLFLSGYQMARDEFAQQIDSQVTMKLVESKEQLDHTIAVQIIFIKRENPELFIAALKKLPDIDERIIFVKNFELFEKSLFDAVKDSNNLILSGDLDACSFGKEIISKRWKSTILFSQPKIEVKLLLPKLERYQGYFYGGDKEGIVALQMNSA